MPSQVKLLDELLSFKNYFAEVTGGMPADDFLLLESDSSGVSIITNNRYAQPRYRLKYAWLADEQRLIKGKVFTGKLSIPGLDLREDVVTDSDAKVLHLRECLETAFDNAVASVENVWIDIKARGWQLHADLLIRGHRTESFSLVFRLYWPDGGYVKLIDGSQLYVSVELKSVPDYSSRYKIDSFLGLDRFAGLGPGDHKLFVEACIYDDMNQKDVHRSPRHPIAFTRRPHLSS